MNLKFLLLFLAVLTHAQGFTQITSVRDFPLDQPSFLTTDNTGNTYVVDRNELLMFNRADTLYKRFSSITLGTIHHVDALNPMKILLFFRDQGKVLFLDNTVSEFTQPFSLPAQGLEQATLVCSSYDNGFWVYNPAEFALVRFDQQAVQTVTVKGINQLVNAPEINPNFMLERNNLLYVNDPAIGIMVFDVFGGFTKIIPIKELPYFQVIGKMLVYPAPGGVFFYNMQLFTETGYKLPTSEKVLGCNVQFEKLFLLTENALHIYTIN